MPGIKWQVFATQLTRHIVGKDILGRPAKRKKPVTGSISHKRSGDVPSAAYRTVARRRRPDGHDTTSFTGAWARTGGRREERTAVATRVIGIRRDILKI